jgi:outer membrane protein assembly factor BamB
VTPKKLLFLVSLCAGLIQSAAAQNEETAAQSTTPIWRQALGGSVIGLPSVQAGSVTVVCDGGNLKTYSAQGTFLWDFYAQGRLTPFVSRSPEGTSYICRTNGILMAVNRSGRELWRINLGEPITGPVLIGWDGRIFVPGSARIRCYTASGYPLWDIKPGSPLALPLTEDKQGGVITALINGELLQIDAFGSLRSRTLAAAPAFAVPLAGTEGAAQIALLYKNGDAEIIGEDTAEAAFVRFSLGGVPLAAAGRGDTLAVVLSSGKTALYSRTGGPARWTGDSHIAQGGAASKTAGLLYDERGVYVLSPSGATGFSLEGERLWMLWLQGAATVPVFSDDGLLFSGGGDWILYAYRMEDRARSRKQSIFGPAAEGVYGTGNPPPANYDSPFGEGEMTIQLERISQAIKSGQIGPDEMAYAAYLMEIAGGAGTIPGTNLNMRELHPPVNVRYRAEAVRLLSFMGSRETIPFLADLLRREPDSSVKTAIAEALGRIGVDPDGLALQAVSSLILPPRPSHDEQVLSALAAAVGSLCRFSGPPLSDTGVRLLVILAGENQPTVARRAALRELDSLH